MVLEENPVRDSIIYASLAGVITFLIFYLLTPLGLGVAFLATLAAFTFTGLATYSGSSIDTRAAPRSTPINVLPPDTSTRFGAKNVMGQFGDRLPPELQSNP